MNNKKTTLPATVEEAFAQVGIDTQMPDLSTIPERFRKPMEAFYKLMVTNEAINGVDYNPDWDDSSERKWWPWFYLNSPCFRFYVSGSASGRSYSSVGSRLCFKSETLSDYSAKTFTGLYRDIMVKDGVMDLNKLQKKVTDRIGVLNQSHTGLALRDAINNDPEILDLESQIKKLVTT
jgi:hypothetical protein